VVAKCHTVIGAKQKDTLLRYVMLRCFVTYMRVVTTSSLGVLNFEQEKKWLSRVVMQLRG
jgi:hypothetical protein